MLSQRSCPLLLIVLLSKSHKVVCLQLIRLPVYSFGSSCLPAVQRSCICCQFCRSAEDDSITCARPVNRRHGNITTSSSSVSPTQVAPHTISIYKKTLFTSLTLTRRLYTRPTIHYALPEYPPVLSRTVSWIYKSFLNSKASYLFVKTNAFK